MMRSIATNASMWMQREQSHNQRINYKPETYQMIAENKNFSKLKCNYSKNELLFKFCKWTKREKGMQLLIFLFKGKQSRQAE